MTPVIIPQRERDEILQALRDGYGVEDIAAMRISSANIARLVIKRLRMSGQLLDELVIK